MPTGETSACGLLLSEGAITVNIISVACGVALLLWAVNDIFNTVFVFGGGAGRQSGRLATWMWRGALRLHDPSSERSHRRLSAVGPLIVLVVLVVWVAQLMLGWALVFVPSAFVSPEAVTFGDRFVMAGRTVVGRGGNHPALATSSGTWEVLQGVAGLSGVTILSIGLAYVLPILNAVAEKRSVAVRINVLGTDVDDIQGLLTRTGGGQFELQLLALTPPLIETAERHRAYPVLHYFHSKERHAALAPAIAKLVAVLETGVPHSPDTDASVIEPLGRAVCDLLDAVGTMGLERYAEQIGLADGLNDIALTPANGPVLPNRSWLEAFVRYDGWDHGDVEQPVNESRPLDPGSSTA